MAKVSLVINAILIIAVGYLFMKMNQEEEKQEIPEEEISEAVLPNDSIPQTVKIAYVLGDSINEKYQYLIDKTAEHNKRSKSSQRKIDRKIEDAQKRYEELAMMAQTGAIQSQEELMQAENELQQLQVTIEDLQQVEGDKLAQLQIDAQIEMYEKVQSYLKDYGAEKGIDIVLNIQAGGSVLYSNELLDVTSEVVRGLNSAYSKEKLIVNGEGE